MSLTLPTIIQGGMGVAVSNWRLARAVSRLGQLGVVSGTCLSVVLARRLQLGDPGGHMRRALSRFPIPAVVERVLRNYYVPGGKRAGTPFKPVAMPGVDPSPSWLELTVAAVFAEVSLAREGHDHPVGVNLLEKVQVATLASLFGAMLAGVGYVLMGAGIPRSIPGVLDHFAAGEAADLKIDVEGAVAGGEATARFDPQDFFHGTSAAPRLERPKFLAIVSSATLALTLARKSNGRVDGFVVESDVAGGHNAPPRGPLQLSASGEPVYGPRDVADLAKIAELGLPFWLAGARAEPAELAAAQRAGAQGVQIGTAFAFCEESGIDQELKREVCRRATHGGVRVHTDPHASPTGFPFKVVQLDGTLADAAGYATRERICDIGHLRQVFARPDGTPGYRCPAEPADDFLRKGGAAALVPGRKCLCNGLLATVGLGQVRAGATELPIVTAGNDVAQLGRFLRNGAESYTAEAVVRSVLAPPAHAETIPSVALVATPTGIS